MLIVASQSHVNRILKTEEYGAIWHLTGTIFLYFAFANSSFGSGNLPADIITRKNKLYKHVLE